MTLVGVRTPALLFAGLVLLLMPPGFATAQGLSPVEPEQEQTDAALPPPPENALDKADLEFYLRHLYVWRPQISVEIGDFEPAPIAGMLQTRVRASYKLQAQEKLFFVSKDGKHVIEGTAYKIDENPFRETIEKIDNQGRPSLGTAGAPVALAVFSDFQCPYCAQEAKLIREQIPKEFPEQVRVYFHDFPLRSHDWAMDAAVAGRCIHEAAPEKFWAYHDWIFESQRGITLQNLSDKVAEFAQQQGLDTLKLSQCSDSEETRKRVEASIEMGRSAGVTSTPTLFVNGRRLAGSYKWENLKQVIDYEIEYQKVTQNAGDDCGCAVTLPFPQNE